MLTSARALSCILAAAAAAAAATPPDTPPPPPPEYWPTRGWRTADAESVGMSATKLVAAAEWVGGLQSPDALLVIRKGYLVSETYWGATTRDSMHDLESGTKSIGGIALAHAVHAGHFTPETNVSDYLPQLAGLSPVAAAQPLQLKHLLSMAGGANVTYWQGRDPASYGEPAWGWQLRQGPPGAVAFCAEHGILKRPGSDFLCEPARPPVRPPGSRARTHAHSP